LYRYKLNEVCNKRKKQPKRERMMEVKKVAEEWEIWDEEVEVAKLE